VVDALSIIGIRTRLTKRGRALCEKMRELIPSPDVRSRDSSRNRRQIIARESVKALRKNVTAKCYGGDITRIRKSCSEKQKEARKRMNTGRRVGDSARGFPALLKVGEWAAVANQHATFPKHRR